MRTMLQTNAEELRAASAKTPFDCVVVGGGSAGLTAARTLSEHGRRVAVVEAGPAPFLTHVSNTSLRYSRALTENLRNQVSYGPKLTDGRAFGPNFSCLGGRGLFWNGAAPRFRAHDFEDWPFGAADLESDYAWAEREFHVTRLVGGTRIASALIALLRKEGLAAEPAPFAADVSFTPDGRLHPEVASGLGLFLRSAAGALTRGEIHVATDTVVRRVMHQGQAVQGVIAASASDGQALHEIAAKSVVLAGGGVESIRLAALSEVPDPEGRIGRGLQDHLFYRAYFDAPQWYAADRPDFGAVYVPSASATGHQWEIHAPGRRLFAIDDATAWAPAKGEPYQLMVRAFAATEKRDVNRVETMDGPLGSARIHFEWSDTDLARKAIIEAEAAHLASALAATMDGPRVAPPGASYHEAGGLDMGADPRRSVLTPEGAFHHMRGLYCVDAAAFPRIGATNPHLTIVAVSRRQSRRLAARLAEN